MTRPAARVSISVVCLLIGVVSSPARGAGVTPQEVDKAIKRGVEFLYSQQNAQGNWESTAGPGQNARKEPADPKSGQFGGFSAIATYALLDAGESWKDKRVRDALEWLNKAPMIGTYAIALRAQVWQYLPQGPGVKAAAQRDCGMLLNGMKSKADARGMWAYFVSDGNSPRYDHSTSQIALLGVWAANQAGREVPAAFWKESENAWRSHQNDDGGWSYIYKAQGDQGQSKMSMTLAGVATLFIAQDYVHGTDGIACKGNVFDDRLVKGTKWIYDHLQQGLGGGGGYVQYGMERVAIASGYKYFGNYDWYAKGAEAYVRGQQGNGSWGDVPETAFAVVFLSRGRAPVIMNKFEYELEPASTAAKPGAGKVDPLAAAAAAAAAGAGGGAKATTPDATPSQPFVGNWCQRPRDVAIFSRWMTEVTERKLNWQIISSKNTVDDLHDAPVLYMSGNQKLTLPKATVDMLRQYIEEGGLLFGQADCASKEFADSFVALGKQMFPAYEFRELPADHPIYTRQQFLRKNWKSPPSVLALSNGTRELMVMTPTSDVARNWQQGTYLGKEETFQVVNGIILYAVDRQNLKYKGASHVVRADPTAAGGGRAIKVARLEFAGNWNPEPAGWARLAAILQKEQKAQVTTEAVKLGEGKLDAAAYPIAHLTGTGGFTFTKEQLNELKKYVAKGGTVLCDAAGGNSEFATSAEAQLTQIIGGAKLEPIVPDDPVLANVKGGPQGGAGAVPMVAPPPIFQPEAIRLTGPATQATTQAAGGATTMPAVPSSKSLLPEVPPEPPATKPTTEATKTVLAGGFPVDYRQFARARLSASDTLRLKGIKFRKKWAVIYSAEDLSTGMVGQPVDGIYGYSPASATEIVKRLVVNLAPADQPAATPATTGQ